MTIEFGIPSIDNLIHSTASSSQSAVKRESLCIIGPDGVGKSVLAMHAASWYWMNLRAKAEEERKERKEEEKEEKEEKEKGEKGEDSGSPVIIYASTDFRFAQFRKTWTAFGLNDPIHRVLSLDGIVDFDFIRYKTDPLNLSDKLLDFREKVLQEYDITNLQKKREDFNNDNKDEKYIVPLQPILPFKDIPDWLNNVQGQDKLDKNFEREWASISELLEHPQPDCPPPIWFLDLADFSGGDDWLLINRLCGMLSTLKNDSETPHLFVLDAVEGVEAMTGDVDPYGTSHSRRSRVAQFMRTASNANVNTILIVEETEGNQKLPEEFIVDKVIRLRSVEDGNYLRRTIEVEKARATSHIRAQHDLVIRSGEGTVTGEGAGRFCHIDDPRVMQKSGIDWDFNHTNDSPLSYLFAAHTLHAYSHNLKRSNKTEPKLHTAPKFPLFGLKHLRHMLGQKSPEIEFPEEGIENGSVTVLLGDSGTFKSKLGRNFLAQNFICEEKVSKGCSVLISTYGADVEDLKNQIVLHADDAINKNGWKEPPPIGGVAEACDKAIRTGRLITRRIPLHYTTSGMFLRIVRAHISECQRRLNDGDVQKAWQDLDSSACNEEDQKKAWETIRSHSWKIRIVIDDWNLLLSSHPAMKNDPLLLPTLHYLLRREGVTALITSTQPERPLLLQRDSFSTNSPNNLRTLDTHQIIVWPVLFFGERRIAFTAAPGSSVLARSISYELLQEIPNDEDRKGYPEVLTINRHFALYSGLQENNPKRIPLRLRLFLDRNRENKGGSKSYFEEITNVFSELYPDQDGQPTITFESIESYGSLASFADWMDNSSLDYSHVIQIDEFWLQGKSLRNLLNLDDYVHAQTAIWSWDTNKEKAKIEANVDNDPLRRFQPHGPLHKPSLPLHLPLRKGEDPAPEVGYEIVNDKIQFKYRRIDFFPKDSLSRHEVQNKKHGSGEGSIQFRDMNDWPYDRVPFQKDFGFLLVRRDLWEKVTNKNEEDKSEKDKAATKIWNSLCLCPDVGQYFQNKSYDLTGSFKKKKKITWEEFFIACDHVKGSESIPSFDIDFSIGETLNTFVLEVWFSEIMKTKTDISTLQDFSIRNGGTIDGHSLKSLRELIHEQSLTLFVALSRVMKACSHLLGDKIKIHSPANQNAVASRQWYSSASLAMQDAFNFVPMRLPGNFSTRGDWFLAAAAGSRSQLATHRAMDILTSRRMNLLCLQDGLGLPARSVTHPSGMNRIPTAMSIKHPTSNLHKTFTLGDIEAMEGTRSDKMEGKDLSLEERKKLFWPLWRSQIRNYDRHSFYFFRWLKGIFAEADRPFVEEFNEEELNEIYNRISGMAQDNEEPFGDRFPKEQNSFREFCELRNQLASGLRE